jgi:dynactin 5
MEGYDKDEMNNYIQTSTQNYVSRKAVVEQPSRVELKGKSILEEGCILRGDLAVIRMGRYCYVGSRTELSPAPADSEDNNAETITATTTATTDNRQKLYIPMIVRGNVYIGPDCKIEASAIGTNVYIGARSCIGPRCILKDNVYVEEGTVLGSDTVIPPFSRVRGNPGKVVTSGESLPPSAAMELQELAHTTFHTFVTGNKMR